MVFTYIYMLYCINVKDTERTGIKRNWLMVAKKSQHPGRGWNLKEKWCSNPSLHPKCPKVREDQIFHAPRQLGRSSVLILPQFFCSIQVITQVCLYKRPTNTLNKVQPQHSLSASTSLGQWFFTWWVIQILIPKRSGPLEDLLNKCFGFHWPNHKT